MTRTLLALLVAFAASIGSAQDAPAPPDVVWEFVGGDSAAVEALALVDPLDGAPHGLPHPALASLNYRYPGEIIRYVDGLYRLDDPDGGGVPPDPNPAWALVESETAFSVYADASGLILVAQFVGNQADRVARSTDGGVTWEGVATDDCHGNSSIDPRIVRTTGPGREGALWVVGTLCRSDDDGATWEPVLEEAPEFVRPRDLLELPPSAALPGGRLVLGVGSGVLTSDDSGATWAATSLYQEFRWVGDALALVPDPAHPYGGTVHLVARDFLYVDGATVVALASDDGGATWEERHRFTDGSFGLARIESESPLVALGDGSLVAGLILSRSGLAEDHGLVVWSGDGGRTWAPLGGVPPWLGADPPAGACDVEGPGPACPGGAWPGWGAQLLRVDRSGRVWAATENGVWRTAGPAWAVASEGPRGPGEGLDVSVRPNPSAGRVEVVVEGAASRPVRVVVLDALGREVAVVWDGPVRAGQRLEAPTAGLAPGAYVVRVVSGGAVASVPLVVVR